MQYIQEKGVKLRKCTYMSKHRQAANREKMHALEEYNKIERVDMVSLHTEKHVHSLG